jgi:thiosulfate reductase cytochrome b subunit
MTSASVNSDIPADPNAGLGVGVAKPHHSRTVRLAHWMQAGCFFVLVQSGTVILLAYPRLHWGETGTAGTPALINLPLPFRLDLDRGEARSNHFLSAWILLLTGLVYVIAGLIDGHFRRELLPTREQLQLRSVLKTTIDHLQFKRPSEHEAATYNVLQKVAYLAVIFLLYPFMFLTGLAMSPAVTSVLPFLVNMFGGFQSARTLHFFAANALVLFFIVHIFMVILAGFYSRCRAMITGNLSSRKTQP